ncbi:hypothetical protein GCM10023231_38560 [Olivibacter ginsenosidimutans]|uniref:Uncharacterized protein n=1 Tax=Olivibacter ginsenosidimutans TaxID=1176537 RepID=A0ABP9C6R8_9SPHI
MLKFDAKLRIKKEQKQVKTTNNQNVVQNTLSKNSRYMANLEALILKKDI